jgi:hypothetical protein
VTTSATRSLYCAASTASIRCGYALAMASDTFGASPEPTPSRAWWLACPPCFLARAPVFVPLREEDCSARDSAGAGPGRTLDRDTSSSARAAALRVCDRTAPHALGYQSRCARRDYPARLDRRLRRPNFLPDAGDWRVSRSRISRSAASMCSIASCVAAGRDGK